MNALKNLTLLFFALAITPLAAQKKAKTFKWPGKYEVAVCLTYDDGLDSHLDFAAPALDMFNLKGSFYCTGNSRSLYNRMEDWRQLVKNGHELGNHSLFHPCDAERLDWVKPEYDLNKYTMGQIKTELATANSLLKAVDGNTERTYAFNCSDYKVGGESFVDAIRPLFFAARCDGPIPDNMQEVDAHFMPSWGVNEPTGKEMIAYVEEAREKGTIAIFMFHNVGGGYLNVSAEAHKELLEYLDKNRDRIWTDTFMNVMRYVKEKKQK